jgi:conjugal transfer pilus assembly protein TraB
MKLPAKWHTLFDRVSPRQKQYLLATGVLGAGVGVFWVFLSLSSQPTAKPATEGAAIPGSKIVTNPELAGGVTPLQVAPVDQWLGTAGKELAQYKVEREGQEKFNADRKANEAQIMQRLAELEKRETAPASAPIPASEPQVPAVPAALPPATSASPSSYPPGVPMAASPIQPPVQPVPVAPQVEPAPAMVRVVLGDIGRAPALRAGSTPLAGGAEQGSAKTEHLESYLPVGFIRGELLGGMDAPTGGQAQSNPLPVLIRLKDNAVLPNRFRAGVRECFVIASGYGDISSERAYMRTSNLSCVRHDRSVIEVKIEGNVFGEDGKLGMRGRLVSKQGQLLANALRAGIVGGIGQGFSQGGSTYTDSALGRMVTGPEGTGEQMRRGIGAGVGRALDNLANYYIRLAEQTFPVIEIDGKREVDIVLTRGVRLPVSMSAGEGDPGERYGSMGQGDEDDSAN